MKMTNVEWKDKEKEFIDERRTTDRKTTRE